tara:strand:- start:4591 stop:5688 length:1098 start_codon:yes stop_codon:yes gene_type:complete
MRLAGKQSTKPLPKAVRKQSKDDSFLKKGIRIELGENIEDIKSPTIRPEGVLGGLQAGGRAMAQLAGERPDYGRNVFYDPEWRQAIKKQGINFKDTPLAAAGAYAARFAGDITSDETRKYYWRMNHPLAIADELLRGAVDPTGQLNKYQASLIGLAAVQPAVAMTGAYDPTNLAQLGRPKGFKQNTPRSDDPTQTANPGTELFQRFFQGRTGRPLKYSSAQEEIPSLTKQRYGQYLNFLYNNPDPVGKATGGLVKFTGENLQGNPEARFLGYPVSVPSVTALAGGLVGAREAIKRAPSVTTAVQGGLEGVGGKPVKTRTMGKAPIRRAMVGGLAGSTGGVLAGNLFNRALATTQKNTQLPMSPYE